MIRRVRTRDQRVVPFDRGKILSAVVEAMAAAGQGGRDLADELTDAVTHFLERSQEDDSICDVESIHDMVEKVLMETAHREIARAYVLLREKRARIRETSSGGETVSPGSSRAAR